MFEKSVFAGIPCQRIRPGALRLAAREGDEKKGCFMAGQSAALVKQEQPAAEIVTEMFTEAEEILRGGTKWVR